MRSFSGPQYDVDRWEVAARLRALLEPAIARTRLRNVAAQLEISPRDLRESIDWNDPHPSIAVALAVVQHYGVEPIWLLTGEYDLGSHREALEEPQSVARLLARTSLRRERRESPVLDDSIVGQSLESNVRAD